MTASRFCNVSLLCAAFLMAALPTYAGSTHAQLAPRHDAKFRQGVNANSPRLEVAREEAKAEVNGVVKAMPDSSSGWTSHFTLYVGCTNAPLSSSYSTIQAAVAAAQPYTTIEVCPGFYTATPGDTIVVNTSFIEIKGVSPHAGAETVGCSEPDPQDGTTAFEFTASYDSIKNITVVDCEYGAVIAEAASTVVKGNEVSNSWFSEDYYGVIAVACDKCTISNSDFSGDYFPIETIADVKGTICGNKIEGAGYVSPLDDGILVELSVSDKIKSNTVEAAGFGLDFEEGNEFATVENNHFNGNLTAGIYNVEDNSGNTFEGNYANGNQQVGIYSDGSTGANATPDSGPNRFIKNHAFGNIIADIADESAPYTGSDPNANSGTANYYRGNKANVAIPSQILSQ